MGVRLRSARASRAALLLALVACRAPASEAPPERVLPTELANTAVALHWDADEARLLLRVPPEEQELLYVVSLPGGLGSNDVGLDRGQLGPRQLVTFQRRGARILLFAPNLDWRSSAEREVERRGARDSFAPGVLWGFEALAANDAPGEGTWVDATEFLLRDAHGIVRRLRNAGQGAFRLEASRSTLLPETLRAFPENSLVEALLTFTSEDPGGEVRRTAAVPEAVSLRVRHGFVALPPLEEDGYRPRRFDPRSGFFSLRWSDLAAPVDEPMERRVLVRHALSAERPIRYYVDSAAPEPVRTALLEGARYWAPVFEAAGFPDGFQVELLPPDADPLDLRYHVVEWVHRSTRGWSYGDTLTDPRTGRVLKGHVVLGALRVRQDVLLLEGLLAPYGGDARDERVVEVALDRIRQLAAHEIGHTLGLAHNFAASAGPERQSVMDYPPPRVVPTATGELDLSQAYAPGCGAWDVAAIRYGYTDFGDRPADEARGLREALRANERAGLRYLSDADARGANRAHPLANLWDDGADPLASLERTYRVRDIALGRFGPAALRPGRPLAELERALVPVYLHHRYALEAAVRAIGGVSYAHHVVGEPLPQRVTEPVPAPRQWRALELALRALEPDFLRLPQGLVDRLVPPAPGGGRDRESFEPRAHAFDPLAPARAGATLVLELLLAPERLARLANARDDEQGALTLELFLSRLYEEGLFAERPPDPLRFEVQEVALSALLRRQRSRATDPAVRAALWLRAARLAALPEGRLHPWHRDRLRRFLENPEELETADAPRVPPGSPIGSTWLAPVRCGQDG